MIDLPKRQVSSCQGTSMDIIEAWVILSQSYLISRLKKDVEII